MLAAFAAVAVSGYGLADRLLPTGQTPTPCDGLLECREHVKRAAEERKACVVGCAEAEARVAYYRASLKAGLEDEARQHSLVEQQAFQENVATRLERERKAEFERKLVADREAHRQRLELLAARAEEQRRAEERDQTRRIDYFRQLTKDQRRERLVACHHSRGDCDALTQQLLRACSTSEEVRELVETNERLTVEPTEVLALQGKSSTAS